MSDTRETSITEHLASPLHHASATRKSWRRILRWAVTVVGAGVALARSTTAEACSYDSNEVGIAETCLATTKADYAIPAGSFVIADEAPTSKDATLIWTEDEELSALLERSQRELGDSVYGGAPPPRAWRARGTGTADLPGLKSYYGEIGSCSLDVGAKQRPPSPPPFGATEARVVYTEGGSRGGGCSCPEIDEMTIGMSAPTERPPFIVGWFGTDEAAATSARPADMIIASPISPDGAPTSAIDVSLGESQDHERSGHAFGRTGRYCFALAWMNELGEIGERSPATCLDTRSETDPAVTVNDEGACVCRFTGKRTVSPGAVSFFALAGVVAMVRRFASRRRSARS